MKALPPNQRLFVLEYLKDRNGTKAAIRAGYSAKTADVIASELLGKPEVWDAVQTGLERLAVKVETKAEDVLRGLKELAEYDPAGAFDADGKLLPIHEMPPEVRKAIVSIDNEELFDWVGQGEERERVKVADLRKVKFVSREKAHELLGKFHKLFVDRVEHSADDSFADALKRARVRAKQK